MLNPKKASDRPNGRSLLARFYPEVRFGGYPQICPDTSFFLRVNALLKRESVAIDLGCGRGIDEATDLLSRLKTLKGKCQRVIGLDVDATAAENNRIDEFQLIEGPRWPLEDASADLLMARYVLEHVEHPDEFFEECRRVLRIGGVACFMTSNVLSYFGMAAKLIPNRLHARVVKFSHETSSRDAEDVFPTFHRCNSVGRLRRYLANHGFEPCVFGQTAPPNYLEFSSVAYGLGVLYQKLAPNYFQPALLAFAQRTS